MKKKKNIIIFLALILLLFSFIVLLFFQKKKDNNNFSLAVVDNVKINLEVSKTEAEHYLGLSFRDSLEQSSGMLFLFPKKDIRSFVMRDMKFSLDIVFIDENVIVDIYKDLPFASLASQILYTSSTPVDKVLELNGGFCEKNNISVGDEINFF